MRYRDANLAQRLLRRSAATAPMSWLYVRVLHRIDRPVYRLTRGRHTFVSLISGLPVVMLATTGARTGQPRAWPVLGLPDGDNLVVIASNWGQPHHPAWYHNLRAHPEATVTVDGAPHRVHAHEALGEERDRLWRRALEVYPGWSAYERRVAPRRIPVMVLVPVSDMTA